MLNDSDIFGRDLLLRVVFLSLSWFIALQNFVPISILVAMETIKYNQGRFIDKD